MKNKIFFIIFCMFVLSPPTHAQARVEITNGLVTEILGETSNKSLEDALGTPQKTQALKVKILNGQYKDEEVIIENQLTSNPAYDIALKKGDRVILNVEETSQNLKFYVSDKERMPFLLLIIGTFIASMLALGKTKGAKSVFSTFSTVLLVFLILIPAILNGVTILPVTIGVGVLSAIITILTLNGFNKKSISALIGSVVTLLSVWCLSLLVINLASLSGLTGESGELMWETFPKMNFSGVLISTIVIASLGAITNTSLAISKSIGEMKSVSFKEFFKTGIEIGKEKAVSMTNTLILAYMGFSLPLFLLATTVPLQKFVNLDSVVTEVASALVGSLGIILCVPVTSAISAYLFDKKSLNKD